MLFDGLERLRLQLFLVERSSPLPHRSFCLSASLNLELACRCCGCRRDSGTCPAAGWSCLSMPGGAMISTPTDMACNSTLDFLVVELALAQHLAEFLPRVAVFGRFCFDVGRKSDRRASAGGRSASSTRSSAASSARCRTLAIASSRIILTATSVRSRIMLSTSPADVTDLGKLGCFDLDERRLRKASKASRDFSLADTGRADHQDVLRRNLAAQRFLDLHTTPTIAQCNRDSALGLVLADNVLVQLLDDFPGGHLRHSLLPAGKRGSESRTRSRFVLRSYRFTDPSRFAERSYSSAMTMFWFV